MIYQLPAQPMGKPGSYLAASTAVLS